MAPHYAIEANRNKTHIKTQSIRWRVYAFNPRQGRFIPQELQPGQLQFSETGLAEEWHMGRKKVRNLLATMERLGMITVSTSKVASVVSMFCIEGWTDRQGSYVGNPYHTAPNGIWMVFERPLNGFWTVSIRQWRHAAGKAKTSFSFEICRGLTSLWSVIPRRSRGSLAVRRWRRSQARTFL